MKNNNRMEGSHSLAKPRILLLGSQMTTGGAQRVLLDQADWLHQHGYPVEVAFLYDRDGLRERWQTGRDFSITNLRFRSLQAGAIRNALSFAGGVIRLFRLMRRQKYQVIETFTHHSNLIGCLLGWAAGVPVRIASHHGRIDRMPAWMNRLHTWMVNRGIAQQMVVVSAEVLRQAEEDGIQHGRLAVIANGVSETTGSPPKTSAVLSELTPDPLTTVILSVGRLSYQKAHICLLKALPAVLEQHPNAIAVIAGDGPLRAELEAETDRMGIAAQVRFLGIRPDVPDLMTAANIFILPSRSEGMPLVLLEAMRAGLPVVATDVPGVREALADGQCGVIVPIEEPAALAQAVLRLIQDPALARQLGQAARQRFEQQYTLQKMMEGYLALLDPFSVSRGEGRFSKTA